MPMEPHIRMSKNEAAAWVQDHNDGGAMDYGALLDAFTALYERLPTKDDYRNGVRKMCRDISGLYQVLGDPLIRYALFHNDGSRPVPLKYRWYD